MTTAAKQKTRRWRLHPQFLVDAKGRRTSVVLPVREFKALLEQIEDALDAEEADRILESMKPGDAIPWEQVKREAGL